MLKLKKSLILDTNNKKGWKYMVSALYYKYVLKEKIDLYINVLNLPSCLIVKENIIIHVEIKELCTV